MRLLIGIILFLTTLTGYAQTVPIHIDSIILTHPLCPMENGSITIYSSGGTAPVLYSIDGTVNFQVSNSFTGLAAGLYEIVVRDSSEDEAYTSITLYRHSNTAIDSVQITYPQCGVGNGRFVIEASSGVAPYEYSIDGGASFQPDSTFDSLGQGFYTIVVRDSNQCPAFTNVEIPPPTANTTVTQQGDTLTALATNATFQWVYCPSLQAVAGANTNTIVAEPDSSYAIIVTDTLIACTDTSGCHKTGNNTAIKPSRTVDRISLFPNPATSSLTVDADGLLITGLDITDLSGRLVFASNLKQVGRFSVELDLQPGIYLVLVRTDDTTLVRKLVVQ